MINRDKEAEQLILTWMGRSNIEDEHIGDNVYISKLRKQDIKEIFKQNSHLIGEWELSPEFITHCFRHKFQIDKMSFEDSKQLLTRAIIISRVVKPTSVSSRLVVEATSKNGNVQFTCKPVIGFGSLAFVSESDTDNVLMNADVKIFKEYGAG